jgi:hypothetical protein
MNNAKQAVRVVCVAAAALMMVAGCASKGEVAAPKATPTALEPTPMPAATMTLTAAQEVPPNPSTATGQSTIAIGADKTVTGSVRVMGMTPTMAHIHEAAQGANGPVIVPFVKTADDTFAPAPGAKLTDAQYASYQAGKLYVNVHSATYPGGEVRLQLAPAK